MGPKQGGLKTYYGFSCRVFSARIADTPVRGTARADTERGAHGLAPDAQKEHAKNARRAEEPALPNREISGKIAEKREHRDSGETP
jgi:hypothetical protein